MKQLKDYTDLQMLTGMSDMEIIIAYFVDNDIEEEGMELSHTLAKSRVEKLKHRYNIIKCWAYNIPSDYLYKKYPLDIASQLHRIELDYLVNGEVTDSRLEWAKKNLPDIKEPGVYFQPCIEWLANHGIKFKKTKEATK